VLPLVVEADKWLRRRRAPAPPVPRAHDVVNPARALTEA